MRNDLKILTVFLVLLPLICTASPVSYAARVQDLDEVMSFVRTPEELAHWFSNEFTYRMIFPDGPHSLQEVLLSRTGDCDDLANLASAILTRMNIRNEVIVIRFRDLRIAHAVCAWKDAGGRYSFMSNRELIRTGERTLEGAIKKQYPDCDSMVKADPQMYVCL